MNKLSAVLLLVFASLSLTWFAADLASAEQQSNGRQQLHRADFRVEGVSCVACLRRVAAGLRSCKGVLKADVSIYRPYWSIVIYDRSQTSIDQMRDAIKQEKVKLVDLEDKPIQSIPLVIVPKTASSAAAPKGSAPAQSPTINALARSATNHGTAKSAANRSAAAAPVQR